MFRHPARSTLGHVTIAMPDSIYPANLPPGYPAYLGYADGKWPTAAALRAKFPGAHVLSLTVTGATLNADGIDSEPGNPNPFEAARWAANKLKQSPASRPVMYASLDWMEQLLAGLSALAVARPSVRLLTAHYGAGRHICGPGTCKAGFTADGTQWTSSFAVAAGITIDMSDLNDGFFGAATIPAPSSAVNWTEFDMAKIRLLRQGDADGTGEFWSVHRLQALLKMTGQLQGIDSAARLVTDGAYGPATAAGVRAVQAHYGIAADGVCGAQTWGVLLTGTA